MMLSGFMNHSQQQQTKDSLAVLSLNALIPPWVIRPGWGAVEGFHIRKSCINTDVSSHREERGRWVQRERERVGVGAEKTVMEMKNSVLGIKGDFR